MREEEKQLKVHPEQERQASKDYIHGLQMSCSVASEFTLVRQAIVCMANARGGAKRKRKRRRKKKKWRRKKMKNP